MATLESSSHSRALGSNMAPFNGVKVFSATMIADRERLGEKVTAWIEAHRECELSQIVVTQSSDAAFHCIAITVFFNERPRA